MEQLEDRVAVVTGGGSGIGRAVATQLAGAGMHVVVADIQQDALDATVADLVAAGHRAIGVRTDVSDGDSVDALAEATVAEFGAVHVVHNNAGVGVGGPVWTHTERDWQWVLGVNLMGVVHGVKSFVPRMLAQNDDCHIVNTASVAGLLSVPASSVYCVSKHGVVTLSECLHHELRAANSKVSVSVLCPAFVNTGIAEAGRNRPAELSATNPAAAEYEARILKAVRSGKLSAVDVARMTMDAVKADRFYILTHPAIKPAIEARLRDILDGRQPTNPMP